MGTLQENDQLGNNDQKSLQEETKAKNKIAFLKAYEACGLSVTEACKRINISRRTYYTYLEEDPEFKKDVGYTEDESLDFAEGQLRTLMTGQFKWKMKKDPKTGKDTKAFERDANGQKIKDWITPIDNASVIFFLKTKAKRRGYTYKTEVLHGALEEAQGGGFEINIVRKKKDSGE